MISEKPKSIIVIFGATGDLANRKLFPSIFKLFEGDKLSDEFAVVGVARRTLSNEEFRNNVKDSIGKLAVDKPQALKAFCSHFYYQTLDVSNREQFQQLKELLTQLDGKYKIPENRIFYLAMAPEFFGPIANYLDSEGLKDVKGWTRLVIEKPFGHDLPSAKQLNNEIRKHFSEDEIYRIDHYLGKEMVQNIKVIRFANAIFEPLWNNRFISNIQITSSESLGVEERGRYYEKSGALRDMVQNHMLQMVSLLAMEPPIKLTTEEIRSEKIKALRALRPIKESEVDQYFVRGQYGKGVIYDKEVPAYREEPNVGPDSDTATFVAGKLLIDNFRWAGVPFYIRTGKRLAEKSTKIVVQFKDVPMNLYYTNDEDEKMQPNLLVIHIQPDEGITIHLNAKIGGQTMSTTPVALDYCNNCVDDINTPEAYEKLLYDCMNGDATNFTHWDEVALSWAFVDPISHVWENRKAREFPNYESGSMGPKASDALLAKDDNHWWPVSRHVH